MAKFLMKNQDYAEELLKNYRNWLNKNSNGQKPKSLKIVKATGSAENKALGEKNIKKLVCDLIKQMKKRTYYENIFADHTIRIFDTILKAIRYFTEQRKDRNGTGHVTTINGVSEAEKHQQTIHNTSIVPLYERKQNILLRKLLSSVVCKSSSKNSIIKKRTEHYGDLDSNGLIMLQLLFMIVFVSLLAKS